MKVAPWAWREEEAPGTLVPPCQVRDSFSMLYTDPRGHPQRSIKVALYRYIAMLLLDWVENILYSALHLFELVEYRIKAVVNQSQNGPYIIFY